MNEPEPTPDDYREQLRTAMNYIRQPNPARLPIENAITDAICDQVITDTRDDTDAQAWRRAAIATKAILRSHADEVKSEWLTAYADLPTMWTAADLN